MPIAYRSINADLPPIHALTASADSTSELAGTLPTISASIRSLLASSAALLLSLKTWSICSSVRPLVSGTKKKVHTNPRIQKTAKNV